MSWLISKRRIRASFSALVDFESPHSGVDSASRQAKSPVQPTSEIFRLTSFGSTVTTVNPYTGEETTITYPGYHEENKTIYIVIKNQPVIPYKNDKGETMNLYYEYCYRGHYSDSVWTFPYPQYYGQSDLEYTMIPFKGVPSSGQVDVRVRALIGTLTQRQPLPGFESGDGTYYSFEGVEGDFGVVTVSRDLLFSTVWPSSTVFPTNTETLDPTLSDNFNPPPAANPYATYLLIIIATVCVISVPLVIVMYHNRHQQHKRKAKPSSNDPSNSQFVEVCGVRK